MSYTSSSSAEKEFIMLERNKLVPELMVTDLDTSLAFWVSCLGFEVAYQSPEDGFAYLDLNGAQVMLEQVDPHAGQWLTAPLSKPFGRGINLQIDVVAVTPIIHKLRRAGYALYRECVDTWYRVNQGEVGQREFIVQDPDGYLIRLVERLGERCIAAME
jgi:catechol 2,3-dioxygenase-like lactoylglutathione lyase family enzyme